jgi:hypothetical protein
MITQDEITFETSRDNPAQIASARYEGQIFYLKCLCAESPNRSCYWQTSKGKVLRDGFRLEDATAELLTYLNAHFNMKLAWSTGPTHG